MNCRVVTCCFFYWVNPSSQKIELGLSWSYHYPFSINMKIQNLQPKEARNPAIRRSIPSNPTFHMCFNYLLCFCSPTLSLNLKVVICTAGWRLSSNPLTVASRRLRPIAYHHRKGPSSCECSDSLRSAKIGDFCTPPENERMSPEKEPF